MHAYEAYRRSTQQRTPRRIDLILALYGKALDLLAQASQAATDGRIDTARPMLARTQLIVSALASGYTGSTDATSLNFLRLYEFVAHRLTVGTAADIQDAARILRTLLEGFEAIRDQAVALEAQGIIPSLESEHIVQVNA